MTQYTVVGERGDVLLLAAESELPLSPVASVRTFVARTKELGSPMKLVAVLAHTQFEMLDRDARRTVDVDATKQNASWTPDLHPRDSDGEFIDVSILEGMSAVERSSTGGYDMRKADREQLNELIDASVWNRSARKQFKQVTQSAKAASYSASGKHRELAFLQGAPGVDADALRPRNGDIETRDPTGDEKIIAGLQSTASRHLWNNTFPDGREVHRGISNSAMDSLVNDALGRYEQAGTIDSIALETWGLANYTTKEGTASHFARIYGTGTVSVDATPDDVLVWTEAVAGLSGKSEGEVSLVGRERTLDPEQITTYDTATDETVSLDTVLADPSEYHETAFIQRIVALANADDHRAKQYLKDNGVTQI